MSGPMAGSSFAAAMIPVVMVVIGCAGVLALLFALTTGWIVP